MTVCMDRLEYCHEMMHECIRECIRKYARDPEGSVRCNGECGIKFGECLKTGSWPSGGDSDG